jgi:hypothetical protein
MRLFFEGHGFDNRHDQDKVTFKAVIGNAARVQMTRYQVTGSTLAPDVRHMLHTINRAQA